MDQEKEKEDLEIASFREEREKERKTEIERQKQREKNREKMRREGADQSCRKQHFSFLILYVWFQQAWHQQQVRDFL